MEKEKKTRRGKERLRLRGRGSTNKEKDEPAQGASRFVFLRGRENEGGIDVA
jgi:hypothetical protein